jgi:hypothetical protein
VDFTWIHGPNRAPKPPQEHVYTRDRPKSPHDSHPEEAHPKWGPQGVSQPHRSAEPTLRPPPTQGLPRGASPLVLQLRGSNTILGLSMQGPSRHVLPHAAPGFFAGRGRTGWWSSPNFASILLASRDDTSALYSGRRTQIQGVTILSIEVTMVLPLDLASRRVLGTYL